MIYKTQSPKTPLETLMLQEKCLPLQTNNVYVSYASAARKNVENEFSGNLEI